MGQSKIAERSRNNSSDYSLANCRTVWVEVSDDGGSDGWVRFALWSRRDINIDFGGDAGASRLRPTVEKLATLLGYVAEEDKNGIRPGGSRQCGRRCRLPFSILLLSHANPADSKERLEKALREYFEANGFDYGMVGLRSQAETRGFVRGKDRSVTEDDRQALAKWLMSEDQEFRAAGIAGKRS